MKKFKYLLLIMIFFLVGCHKNSFNREEFIEMGTFNGYIVKADKTGYEEYDYIKEVYYAINRENAYDVQFLELENAEYAKRFFLLNASDIKENMIDRDYLKSMSLSNYEVYHVENETEYLMVLRSNNNIIYIKAPINYINEIEEFLHDLDLDC